MRMLRRIKCGKRKILLSGIDFCDKLNKTDIRPIYCGNTMTNHIFRSSLGGFHRQDVIDYIEKVQKASAEEIAALEEELNAAAERETQIREVLEQDVEEIEALKEQLSGMEELTAMSRKRLRLRRLSCRQQGMRLLR